MIKTKNKIWKSTVGIKMGLWRNLSLERAEECFEIKIGKGDDFMPTMIDSSVTKWQTCMDLCNDCVQACEQCLSSCLKEPDVQARVRCIHLLRDCIDICALATRYMSRNSSYAQQICSICATICEACAAECAKFQDAHCQECADLCRKCAAECRKMSA